MVTNDVRCTREIKYSIAMEKVTFSKKITVFTRKLDLNIRKKLAKCFIWSIAFYGAGTWTLRKVDYKYFASFKLWCLKRMEIIYTDRVNRSIKQS
jgi:hypothetical protein